MSFKTGTHSSNGLLEEIQELIKDQGLTVTTLAVEMGYSRKAMSRFLHGHNTYTDFDLIVKLCKRLGIKAITIE